MSFPTAVVRKLKKRTTRIIERRIVRIDSDRTARLSFPVKGNSGQKVYLALIYRRSAANRSPELILTRHASALL